VIRKQVEKQVSLELLNKSEVAELFGVSERTLSRWQRDPNFPKAIRITSTSRPRWVAADLQHYIDEKSEEVSEVATQFQNSSRRSASPQRVLPRKRQANSSSISWGDLKQEIASQKLMNRGDQ